MVARDLLGEIGRVARAAVHGDDPVAGLQRAHRSRVGLDLIDLLDALGGAEGEPEQQEEGDQQIDRRPGSDHDDALPHGLVVVGAGGNLRWQLFIRVHARDLHEAPQRGRADAVLGLSAPLAEEVGRKEEREALHAHAGFLRGHEVAQLVQDDQRREAREGEHPAHALTASRSTRLPAMRRASKSAS